ncbi:MAG: hypothetical protein IKC08_08470 [Lentisphaeria bacterium]|nr:hypothetical protein [Lentisphaeria bacterium]
MYIECDTANKLMTIHGTAGKDFTVKDSTGKTVDVPLLKATEGEEGFQLLADAALFGILDTGKPSSLYIGNCRK